MILKKSVGWVALAMVLLFSSLGPDRVLPPAQAQYWIYLPIIFKAPYEPEKGFLLPVAYEEFCAEDLVTLNAGWYYQNGTSPPAECPAPDRRFVPRIYNAEAATDINITTAISNAEASGWLLGFGEPNLAWNGDTTPQEGAIAWRRIEELALPAGIKLVAPGPSQHDPCYFSCEDNPHGYEWIWEMVEAYEAEYGEKPHFDALAWNYYDYDYRNFAPFFNARRQEALSYGYDEPFWILEYGGACWNTGGPSYTIGNDRVMTEVTAYFKRTPWITRYAWFTNRISSNEPWDGGTDNSSCSLLNPVSGIPTALGTTYSGY
jgi:hypothetical protein